MKKIITFCLMVLILISSLVYGLENKDFDHCLTDGTINGYVFKAEGSSISFMRGYIIGIRDAFTVAYPDAMFELYPYGTVSHGDFTKAIMAYYEKNPTQRHRPIHEVILSGCK